VRLCASIPRDEGSGVRCTQDWTLSDGWIGILLVPAGRLDIDGHRMTCDRWPTALEPDLDDFGVALPGLVILNPPLFAGLATPVDLQP
jgi:hypothetical protein